MTYFQAILHQKINLWLALLAILIIAALAAWAITAEAQGLAFIFGGRITKVSPCVVDTPDVDPVICSKSCPLCTPLTGAGCGSYNEIVFQPVSGSRSSYICPRKSFQFKGGTPRPGTLILGQGMSAIIIGPEAGVSR